MKEQPKLAATLIKAGVDLDMICDQCALVGPIVLKAAHEAMNNGEDETGNKLLAIASGAAMIFAGLAVIRGKSKTQMVKAYRDTHGISDADHS